MKKWQELCIDEIRSLHVKFDKLNDKLENKIDKIENKIDKELAPLKKHMNQSKTIGLILVLVCPTILGGLIAYLS